MPSNDGRVLGAATLVDVLVERARAGDGGGFVFLGDGASPTEALSWAELAARAGALSAGLQSRARAGDRALLFFRPGLDFLAAFLGCLHAGVVAVPCVPPSRPFKRSLERISEVVRTAAPALIVAGPNAFPGGEELAAAAAPWTACPVVTAAELARSGDIAAESRARRDGVAFLQFTSGSTSAPKGAVVTHANLMQNLASIHECVDHSRESVSVTWLPIYHDMGLIDGMLEPIFAGSRCVAMPPHAFIQRPARWLRAIHAHRATHSGGPNFAYDLCVARIRDAEIEGVDLSSWRFAHDGAEPVRASTMSAFARRFAAAGFRRGAFYPCYGLAEATLNVAGGAADSLRPRAFDGAALERGQVIEVGTEAPRARAIASSGRAFRDFDLAIVDPESCRALAEGALGEIWLAGPSVAAGYFGNAEATAETFGARIAGSDRGPFLRTGDLGFLLGGELYVAGRHKDLVILGGRNLYPHDIERSVETDAEGVAAGGSVAFSIDDGSSERLIVLVEVAIPDGPEDAALVARALDRAARAVARDHLVDPSAILAVPRGALLRTTSGKIRRRACRAAFTEGRFPVIERLDAAPRDPALAATLPRDLPETSHS
jgi:acyl-CoA synthetase (AMP-forming)/AMP-acid ligase II